MRNALGDRDRPPLEPLPPPPGLELRDGEPMKRCLGLGVRCTGPCEAGLLEPRHGLLSCRRWTSCCADGERVVAATAAAARPPASLRALRGTGGIKLQANAADSALGQRPVRSKPRDALNMALKEGWDGSGEK